jgi:hypothetical protein
LYKSPGGQAVRITIFEGRLMAFPEDGPGVYLQPAEDHTFTAVMTEPASVAFEMDGGVAGALIFTLAGRQVRFVRAKGES